MSTNDRNSISGTGFCKIHKLQHQFLDKTICQTILLDQKVEHCIRKINKKKHCSKITPITKTHVCCIMYCHIASIHFSNSVQAEL